MAGGSAVVRLVGSRCDIWAGQTLTRQRTLLNQWLPQASVEKAHSWGQVDTTVLELANAGYRFIVKAGGESDPHL